MNNTSLDISMFDADEYFHLALHASALGDRRACMEYLKKLLQSEPQHAKAMYLLAAQHAEIGMYARAIAGMQSALALDPKLETARFQLGLLLLDQGKSTDARNYFQSLEASSDAALRSCGRAMRELLTGDRRAAARQFATAATQVRSNAALADWIRQVKERIEGSEPTSPESPAADDRNVLRAYAVKS